MPLMYWSKVEQGDWGNLLIHQKNSENIVSFAKQIINMKFSNFFKRKLIPKNKIEMEY